MEAVQSMSDTVVYGEIVEEPEGYVTSAVDEK